MTADDPREPPSDPDALKKKQREATRVISGSARSATTPPPLPTPATGSPSRSASRPASRPVTAPA
ncbi:MAG: hypothetical protein U1F43_37350 [Myxococcota bacterium]